MRERWKGGNLREEISFRLGDAPKTEKTFILGRGNGEKSSMTEKDGRSDEPLGIS